MRRVFQDLPSGSDEKIGKFGDGGGLVYNFNVKWPQVSRSQLPRQGTGFDFITDVVASERLHMQDENCLCER